MRRQQQLLEPSFARILARNFKPRQCSIAACKAKAGMCTHEKVAAGLIALLLVGLVVAKGLSLF